MGDGSFKPIPNPQLPIPNYQSPITNPQLPIPNPQLPITNPQLPIPNPQFNQQLVTYWGQKNVNPATLDKARNCLNQQIHTPNLTLERLSDNYHYVLGG